MGIKEYNLNSLQDAFDLGLSIDNSFGFTQPSDTEFEVFRDMIIKQVFNDKENNHNEE